MSGLLQARGLDTRVAWVHDLFEQIDVDSREERAVAISGLKPTRVPAPVGFSKQLVPAGRIEPATKP